MSLLDWEQDFPQLTDEDRSDFLSELANMDSRLDDREWHRYRLTVAAMPLQHVNNTRFWRKRLNFYDIVLNNLWRYVDTTNGKFCRLNPSFGETPAAREKYLSRVMEIATILKDKGARPSCPTDFAERYAYFRSLEKTAGQGARLFAPCAEAQAGKTIAESPIVRDYYWRPGGLHDRVHDPVVAESRFKRRFEEDIEPVNKRARASGGAAKGQSRRASRRRRK
jgi:hypothetical protein